MKLILQKLILASALLFTAKCGMAQIALTKPVNILPSYQKGMRTDNGKPGPNYWQNRANYTIKVNFNPTDRHITGTVDIDYTNNSPDTLKEVWFKLYPNLYKKGTPRDSNISADDITDGVQISALSINQAAQDVKSLQIRGTNMILPHTPVLPGETKHFTISYTYVLNKGSHIRTGQVDSGAYFVAYFFPRVAVYDDIDGWNKYQYLGSQEFYNDFCHFDAEITVPGNYVVWGTGTLQNPAEVFDQKIVKLIDDAGKSDAVTDIITESDLKNGHITLSAPTHTWKLKADSVTDLVFATSNHYIWKASSLVVDPATGRRTSVDATFNPKHKDYFEVVNYARQTVEAMSYKFPKWPYPYPHETVFDGLDQMEYPMMVNDNPVENPADAIELTDHEIFHTMFPFYMGINETKYGWMDEGWATIGEWIISPLIDPKIDDDYGVQGYEQSAGTEADQPIITLTTQISGISGFTDSYPKPAMGYLYVKDMLGDELFTKALHYYIAQWHGKHPSPYDFFNCINTGSGRNLNWFWKRWFFDGGVPDLAISKVTHQNIHYQVVISSVGTKPTPINLKVEYASGKFKLIHRDVSCWEAGNKTVTLVFDADRTVKQLTLGTTYDPDRDKSNNVYVEKK